MTISSWLNFGHPTPPGRGSAVGQIFLAPPYYSQRTVFVSLLSAFSFRFVAARFGICDIVMRWWKFENVTTTLVTWLLTRRRKFSLPVGERLTNGVFCVIFWFCHSVLCCKHIQTSVKSCLFYFTLFLSFIFFYLPGRVVFPVFTLLLLLCYVGCYYLFLFDAFAALTLLVTEMASGLQKYRTSSPKGSF